MASTIRVILRSTLTTAALAACTGGVGTLPGLDDFYDPHPGVREPSGSGREAPPISNDPGRSSADRPSRGGVETAPGTVVGGGGGAGGFQCAGTYVCVEQGDSDEDRVVLVSDGQGGCVADGVSLNPNGTIVARGQVVGSWSSSGDGFTVTVQGQTSTCRRSGSGSGSGSNPSEGSGGGTPGSPGTANPTPVPPPVIVDAGG